MDINYRGPDWPSIYFNPDFKEMIALTKSFDTLRIGLKREKGKYNLVIASGYGNTHSTLSRALGELNPRCKVSKFDGLKYDGLDGCAILYEEDNKYWFNMADLRGDEKETPEVALRTFGEPAKSMLKEIVKLSQERLGYI
jgi:hypothetical protein